MKKRIDILFIHIGRHLGGSIDTIGMPVGLLMLADFLDKNGIRPGVLNLTAELIENPSFDLARFIRRRDPEILALPLHWHFQLKDVLAGIRRLRKEFPSKKVICGGATASGFYREIMDSTGRPDFIIRGDAETPLLLLCRSLLEGRPQPRSIPNLVWRDNDGGTKTTPQTYVVTRKILDSLSYSRLDLLENRRAVLRLSRNHTVLRKKGEILYTEPLRSKAYYVAGRGCSGACSFCGGGKLAQELLCGRRAYIFKSETSVVADIKEFLAAGIKKIHFAFDPSPASGYYPRLFSEFKKAGLRFEADFECFGLPGKEFLRSFARTFNGGPEGSRLIISPESGSERVRAANKTLFYSNARLMAALTLMAELGIKASLCFSSGIPYETKADFKETMSLAERISALFPWVELSISPIQIEPFSPMHSAPGKYGIKLRRESFADFLRQRPGSLGYTGGLSENEVMRNVRRFRKRFR